MSRRHLAVVTKDGHLRRVGCRIDSKDLDMTTRPSEVTCKACIKSVDMADSEIKTIGRGPRKAGKA